MKKKNSNKLKIALAIVSTIAVIAVGLIVFALLSSGPWKGSAIYKIMEVDDSFMDNYDTAVSDYAKAYDSSYSSEVGIEDGKKEFSRLSEQFETLKTNASYTRDIANEAIPKTKGDKKDFLELSLECDEKRIQALEKFQAVSTNYQNYLGYLNSTSSFNKKHIELIALATEFALYNEEADRKKAMNTLSEMEDKLAPMKTDLEAAKTFVTVPSLTLYSQWAEVYSQTLNLIKKSLQSSGSTAETYAKQASEKAVESSRLINKASIDNEKEINDWFYNNIEKLDLEASKLSGEASTLCGNAEGIYASMYPE